jgi:hypothetical protein
MWLRPRGVFVRWQTLSAGDALNMKRKTKMQIQKETYTKKSTNGAARGGNIALGVACIAIIVLPLFGWFIAGPLLLAAFICSIVAIAQNAARQGIVLMFGSILMPIIAQLVGIAMWANIGAAGSNEAKKQQDQQPQAVSAAYSVQSQPSQRESQPKAVPAVIAQSVPTSVEQRIRQIYAEKYPDNFSMQKTLIEDQLESYRYIERWTSESGVPQDVFNKVKETYAQKYPDNYSMQKTLVQDQCESYRFLQSYTSVAGVPDIVFANLKQKYAQRYTYNFSMQKTLVENQVKSFLDLHK